MRIIIPTRNRPASLSGVLDYYQTFYPETQIIIADGSSDEYKPQNEALVQECDLPIDYRVYDADISLFDRLLMVLNEEKDEYFIMAADDDYPILETLEKARKALDNDKDAVCAGGFLVHIKVLDEHNANARLDPARHIVSPIISRRMQVFGQLPFTTTYAVARRTLLIERYKFLRNWNMPGFFDLAVGLIDVMQGKFIAIPELGFICTRNYTHSYYRANEKLVVLRRANEVLELCDILCTRLCDLEDIDSEQAKEIVVNIINKRIAAVSGMPPFRVAGFTERAPYATKMIDDCRKEFAGLFRENTSQRKYFGSKLDLISENLVRTLSSSDNFDEQGEYESF